MRQKGQQNSQHWRNDTIPHYRRGIFFTMRGKIGKQAAHEAQNDDNYRNFYNFFRLQRMSIPEAHAFALKFISYAIVVFRWIYKQNLHKSRVKPARTANRIFAELFFISGYNVFAGMKVTNETFRSGLQVSQVFGAEAGSWKGHLATCSIVSRNKKI
jgi:hypothetical protein